MEPCFLTGTEAATLIAARALSCVVRSCLARMEARDHVVRAWLDVDPELAIRRARDLDGYRGEIGAARHSVRGQGRHRHP